MATIREHEPAEGLRKENREISAKMKEDEQMQKDTDAEKRTEATEAGAQPPKKKNIIQVFRPQNSKTGMVKPGARPKPQGTGKQGAKPAAKAENTPKETTLEKAPEKVAETAKTPETKAAAPVKAAETSAKPQSTGARPQGDRVQGSRPQGDRARVQSDRAQSGGRSQNGGRSYDGQGRSQGGGRSNDGQGRSQGGGRSYDGQGRSQGGGRSYDGQGRSQGGGRSYDGQGRSQGGGRSYDGQGRSQGGGRSYDGQGRSQGGGRSYDGQGRSQGGGRSFDGQGRGQGGRGQNGASIPKAPTESKPLEKESRKRTERGDRNRVEKGEKLERMEKNQSGRPNQKGGKKPQAPAKPPVQKQEKPEDTIRTITIPEKLTISELGEAMKVQPAQIVKKLFLQGTMVTVNQEIEFDKAEEIALEFNCICEKEVKVDVIEELLKEDEDAGEDHLYPVRQSYVSWVTLTTVRHPCWMQSVTRMSSTVRQAESHSTSVRTLYPSTDRRSPSWIRRVMRHLLQCVCVVQILQILRFWSWRQTTA